LQKSEKKKDSSIVRVRSVRDGEFANYSFITYCEEHGIKHKFSFP